jgi:hypothetical protein
MLIPCFPEFVPVDLSLKKELHPRLSLTADGISEFTFAGLYLFRNRYQYRVSLGPEETFIISGIQPDITFHGAGKPPDSPVKGRLFFLTPCMSPGRKILDGLFETHDYWKNIPQSILDREKENLEQSGVEITEDRDNFDYLYLRTDLAELAGKKFHKKKNLVNTFKNTYPDHGIAPLTPDLVPQAFEILDEWTREKGEEGDYAAAREALELFETLKLRGSVFYVDKKPAGWCLGESLAKGRMFAIHFEKALEAYKGLYQYLNQAFAAGLPRFFTYINREQDLGEEGLRQAKETYRPAGFVKKYTGRRR